MNRSAIGTCLLAFLAVMAGCTGPLGAAPDGGATPTVTPVPMGDAPAPAAHSEELAPWVGSDGVTDPERLLDAHAAALENGSYTVRLSSRRTAANGTETVRYDRELRVAGRERFHYVLDVERPDGDRRIERWRDGATARGAVTENGSRTVRTLSSPARPSLVSCTELVLLFALPSTVVESAERNGTTVHRMVGGPRDRHPLSNVTIDARITERGLIRSYEVSYTVERLAADEQESVVVEASITDVGSTTVEPPSD